MGRKQTGTRKQIYLYIAVLLITFMIVGCHSLPPDKKETRPKRDNALSHLDSGKSLFGDGDFAGSMRELEKASSPATKNWIAQEAFLYLGLNYADPANPKRDHTRAFTYFKKLSEGYPRSTVTEQARIMLAIMKENDESNRTIDKLRAIIEASKKVDREIEEKRREKTGK